MNQNTKDWVKLIALIFGSGGTVAVTAIQGGVKPWLGFLLGLATAGTNIYHALNDKPGDRPAVTAASVEANQDRKEAKTNL